MMNYNNLTPGLYLQTGNSIKSLQVALDAWRSNDYGTGAPDNVETLAAAVAWVFIAVERRKQRLAELPFQWRQDEQDVEVLPFRFNTHETMPRLDEAIQLYKQGYLLKQRGASGALVGLRWLDPTTMEAISKSWTPEDGVTQYMRTVKGRKEPIAAEDLLVFMVPGMREIGPGTPAGRATSFAAQILYGVQQTADTIYDNNALPPMLVNVPEGTLEADKDTIVDKIRALLNPKRKGTREHRVVGIVNGGDKGVEVVPLSIKPDDLAMPELSEQYRDAILSGHFVPISEALSNASSRQTSDSNDAMRLTATMGARADWLAGIINNDPDIQALGLTLDYFPEKHWSMKVREMQGAMMFSQLLAGMTPAAAGYLAGITADSFPDEIRAAGIFRDTAGITPSANVNQADVNAPPTNLESIAGLNGAQIQAALRILAGYSNQEISKDAAKELLTALGIEQARVDRIVSTTDLNPNPNPSDATVKANLLADLDKWRRKAEKRLKATGKAACDFESEWIDPLSHTMILEALAEADTPHAVKMIFEMQ